MVANTQLGRPAKKWQFAGTENSKQKKAAK